jgi:uncharacterized protein (TIGR00369 family)
MSPEELRALARDGLFESLGIHITEITHERVVATLSIEPRHLQPFGFLHGGVNLALAESVASLGGNLHCPPGHAAFGMEINANHLRPKRSGTLTAVATPLHLGRTTQVWDVKISDESDRLICASRCTVAVAPLNRTSSTPPD